MTTPAAVIIPIPPFLGGIIIKSGTRPVGHRVRRGRANDFTTTPAAAAPPARPCATLICGFDDAFVSPDRPNGGGYLFDFHKAILPSVQVPQHLVIRREKCFSVTEERGREGEEV